MAQKQGLSLEALAAKLGKSKGHLHAVEKDGYATARLALDIETLTGGACRCSVPEPRDSRGPASAGRLMRSPEMIDLPSRALHCASGPGQLPHACPGPFPITQASTAYPFNLGVRRHRLFETNFYALTPPCRHKESARPIAVYGDHPQQPGDKTYRVNRARTLAEGQEAMGIDWMPWRPLTQAIPPAYTQWLGERLLPLIADARREAA
jgi:hypothetical protein